MYFSHSVARLDGGHLSGCFSRDCNRVSESSTATETSGVALPMLLPLTKSN